MKAPIIERDIKKGYRNMKLHGKDALDREGFETMLLYAETNVFSLLPVFSFTQFNTQLHRQPHYKVFMKTKTEWDSKSAFLCIHAH